MDCWVETLNSFSFSTNNNLLLYLAALNQDFVHPLVTACAAASLYVSICFEHPNVSIFFSLQNGK